MILGILQLALIVGVPLLAAVLIFRLKTWPGLYIAFATGLLLFIWSIVSIPDTNWFSTPSMHLSYFSNNPISDEPCEPEKEYERTSTTYSFGFPFRLVSAIEPEHENHEDYCENEVILHPLGFIANFIIVGSTAKLYEINRQKKVKGEKQTDKKDN